MNNITLVRKEFIYYFGKKPQVIVSAPGRLDFLNTHQDYKGLPVVSVAINLRTYVGVSERSDNLCKVISINLRELGLPYVDSFNVVKPEVVRKEFFGNYIRAAIISLKDVTSDMKGVNIIIYSDIPIGAGLASSGVLLVSVIGAINYLYGLNLRKKDIAELAFKAEHSILNIPCGRLDQYGSVFGGIIKITTKPPYDIEKLPKFKGVFSVIDSGIKHSTKEIHTKIQEELQEGIIKLNRMKDLPLDIKLKLGCNFKDTKWEELNEEEILPYLEKLPHSIKSKILYTLRANRSTELALLIIKGKKIRRKDLLSYMDKSFVRRIKDLRKITLISEIMNYQHILLRDFYGVSTPKLEHLRNVALRAGALGVKISGAGFGGSLIALSTNKKIATKVLKECLKADASRGWVVSIDPQGLKEDYVSK